MARFLVAAALLLAVPAFAAPKGPRHVQLGEVNREGVLMVAGVIADAVVAGEKFVVVDIDSPGGSVYAGLALIDFMRAAHREGTQTICVVDGMAASMGAAILEGGCSYRVMTRRSQILFHEVSVSMIPGGTEWDVRRLADHMSDLNKRLAVIICGRINLPIREFLERTKGRDIWLGYEEAKELGAVDVVIN